MGGLLAGITVAFWAGTGAFIYPAPPTKSIPLQLSTLNCTLANSTEALMTMAAPTAALDRYFPYNYYLNLCSSTACSLSLQCTASKRHGMGAHCQIMHQLQC